jgi:hypothetical protein
MTMRSTTARGMTRRFGLRRTGARYAEAADTRRPPRIITWLNATPSCRAPL